MFLEPGDLFGRWTLEIEILQVALRELLPVNGETDRSGPRPFLDPCPHHETQVIDGLEQPLEEAG